MTLTAVYKANGRCIGRCDARCYLAVGGVCECICGGRNHGVGLAKALDNTREQCDQWVAEACHEHGECAALIHNEAWQPSLPFDV